MKRFFDGGRDTNARFTIKQYTTQPIRESEKDTAMYTLLYGEDPDNNAFFFRVTPIGTQQLVRECVVVFNGSHRLEISSVKLPGQDCASVGGDVEAPLVIHSDTVYDEGIHDPTLFFLRSKFPASRFITSGKYAAAFPNKYDVVSMIAHMRASTWEMAQLHWVYEALCSVTASMVVGKEVVVDGRSGSNDSAKFTPDLQLPGVSSGGGFKLPDMAEEAGKGRETLENQTPAREAGETDDDPFAKKEGMRSKADGLSAQPSFVTMQEFILELKNKETTWAVCVNLIHNFIAMGLFDPNKTKTKFLSCDHDDMLKQIAYMAKLATAIFSEKNTDQAQNGLAFLTSPYNSTINRNTAKPVDLNKSMYFGYKMTQWLLSKVETETIATGKKDRNTRIGHDLRARLMHTDLRFHTSGLKSTYTTDVLLEVVRKSYISPWAEMYGNAAALPAWVEAYSLSSHFSNVAFTEKKKIFDKQVSVRLGHTHKIRFVFDAFHPKFEGSNPVVASKKLADTVVKLKTAPPIVLKSSRSRGINKRKANPALRPVTGKAKDSMLSPTSENRPAPQLFAFGASSGPYSWQ
jgi:hypothetical protein